jgi:hypothetical protein
MGDGRLRSCALTCGALAAVAAALAAAVVATGAWYLFRETPEPPEERFPAGTHTRYVSVRLRPDDEGMRRLALALFERGEEMLFAGPALPAWLRAGREEGWLAMLPVTIEWGAGPSGDDVVRVRFEGNHETPRALFRVLRWGAASGGGVPGTPRAVDLGEGLPALRLPLSDGGHLVVAFLGNRLIASRTEAAIERLVSDPPAAPEAPPAAAAGTFPREDGRGWTDVEALGDDCRVRFSLRLESDDLVRFRAVPESGCAQATAGEERDAFGRRLREEAERIAAAAGLEPSEAPAVSWSGEGEWTVSGRLAGVRERALLAFPSLAAPPGYGPSDAAR